MNFIKLVDQYLFLGGIIFILVTVAGCSEDQKAKALLKSEKSEVISGETVVFDASDSVYEFIEWYKDGSKISECDDSDACAVSFVLGEDLQLQKTKGTSNIKIKVKFNQPSSIPLLGDLTSPSETKDELTQEIVINPVDTTSTTTDSTTTDSTTTDSTTTDSTTTGTVTTTTVSTTTGTAGITVSSISGNTTEAGGTSTFTVKLNSKPEANVTIPVSSSNTAEGTVSISTLTFTSSNYSIAQTVTVTGVDDAVVDGDIAYTIILAAATSSDLNYSGLNPSDVSVTNTDNDIAAPSVTATKVEFKDTNSLLGKLGGPVTITKASSESTINQYVLYWGSSNVIKQSTTAITTITANGSATYTYTFPSNTVIPNSANYLLVFTKNATGESTTAASVAFIDYGGLPDTGHPASATLIFGEDHDYSINPRSYTDNSDGTITDNVTGLIWQKTDDGNNYQWSAAGPYCTSLSLAGYTWRLPSSIEIWTIASFNSNNGGISGGRTYYWTSISDSANPTTIAYYIKLGAGNDPEIQFQAKTNSYGVHCVTGGPIGNGVYTAGTGTETGTVTDSSRGLMWESGTSNLHFDNALNYCEGLTLGGFSDWRMPNIIELYSLTITNSGTHAIPAIDTTFFSSASNLLSSTMSWAGSKPLVINTSSLSAIPGGTYGTVEYVRCVRTL
ncbi:MAG: DUF1566 domain-containing protein [SAR324 cluster bacterium]|nr:DUF1566 domain-containing protein [SAR324 cluster bacterium]